MNNTVRILSRHIREFHPLATSDTGAPLFFVIRNGVRKQMTEDNVRKLLRHYGGKLPEYAKQGLSSIHPHLLRHSRAMHLYQNGMSL
jgi:site-specific recombinase XerD